MANVQDPTTETIPPATTSPVTSPAERQRTGWTVAITLIALAVLVIVILYAVDVL